MLSRPLRASAWLTLAAVLAVVAIAWSAGEVSARVALETYAANPAIGRPKISPDGQRIAAPIWKNGEDSVLIYEIDAAPGAKPIVIPAPEDVEVDWVEWANSNRLLIGLAKHDTARYRGTTYDTSISRVVAIDRDGKNLVVLFGNSRRFRSNYNLSNIVHRLPGDPNSVLMGASKDDRYNLYKVNVVDGKAELVERGTTATYQWLTDLNGVPRARWEYRPRRDRIELWLREGDTVDWDKVAEYGERELPDINIIGFGDDPRIALVASRQSSDRYGIYEYDMVARKLGKLVFQHDKVDVGDPVGGPIYDPLTTRLLGVYYVDDVWERRYFDQNLSRIQDRLDATFLDSAIIRFHSWSIDGTRLVFFTEGPKDPGSYYLYDAKRDHASLIGKRYPGIPTAELGDMLIVKYKSRDGTKLPGYLTMPPGKGDKNLPMIVMPHGGPEARDYVQYDHWAQMLANRGYVVFQPNFRGSGGYGKAFAEAGHRQWGKRMQDDVTDGVKALIADGTADANRVCIVGASYGGYAALAGGAFTPDLYKCVVSIAGVSDIPEMLEEEEDRFTTESAVYDYWVKRLGDPRYDLEQMKAASPARHAANFKAPLLLIHGEHDETVPIGQSKIMDKAMRAAGKPVQFVRIEKEGHHFSKPSSDLTLMTELEKFLTAHIGN
jgi:dipeptidyl aminopeptidase/acylaminoacyl peptidase